MAFFSPKKLFFHVPKALYVWESDFDESADREEVLVYREER